MGHIWPFVLIVLFILILLLYLTTVGSRAFMSTKKDETIATIVIVLKVKYRNGKLFKYCKYFGFKFKINMNKKLYYVWYLYVI